MKWLSIIACAFIVPITIAGQFPPPPGMDAWKAIELWLWLSMIGGLAGYGLWKMP